MSYRGEKNDLRTRRRRLENSCWDFDSPKGGCEASRAGEACDPVGAGAGHAGTIVILDAERSGTTAPYGQRTVPLLKHMLTLGEFDWYHGPALRRSRASKSVNQSVTHQVTLTDGVRRLTKSLALHAHDIFYSRLRNIFTACFTGALRWAIRYEGATTPGGLLTVSERPYNILGMNRCLEAPGDTVYLMCRNQLINVYDSQSEDYGKAFDIFLAHTDQKENALAWLQREVEGLRKQDVFIDAGAGNGQLTSWLAPSFIKTIAIEPNPALQADLRRTCPTAELLSVPILQALPSALADFVLCSHVLYHVGRKHWAEHCHCMARWLRPGGVLAVALQNQTTDCMNMLRHFTGEEFNLRETARSFADENQDEFDLRIDTIEAHVNTDSFKVAYIICEFILNDLPLACPPSRAALECYVNNNFSFDGRYRFSCHQDFLRIQRNLVH